MICQTSFSDNKRCQITNIPQKKKFYAQKIYFFGYIITDKGIKIDSDKVKTIQEWPTPTLAKEILLFLRFTEFY